MSVLESWHKQTDYTNPVETSNPELKALASEHKAQLVIAYWYGQMDPNMASYALEKYGMLAYLKESQNPTECEFAQLGAYELDCHCDRPCSWQASGAYLAVCSKPDGEESEIEEEEAAKWMD